MNSARLKEIMTAQSKAGVGRLELNFETAFEVVEALEQAEQAVARVREVVSEDAPSFFTNEAMRAYDKAMSEITRALDDDGRG